MAALWFFTFMSSSALTAYVYSVRGEPRAVFTAHACGQLSLVYAVRPPFMINETSRPKFRDRQKPRTLQVCRLRTAGADSRNESV